MSKPRYKLCQKCAKDWESQGKLANMAANMTCRNPCYSCRSIGQRVTEYMDAAERAQFEAEATEKRGMGQM